MIFLLLFCFAQRRANALQYNPCYDYNGGTSICKFRSTQATRHRHRNKSLYDFDEDYDCVDDKLYINATSTPLDLNGRRQKNCNLLLFLFFFSFSWFLLFQCFVRCSAFSLCKNNNYIFIHDKKRTTHDQHPSHIASVYKMLRIIHYYYYDYYLKELWKRKKTSSLEEAHAMRSEFNLRHSSCQCSTSVQIRISSICYAYCIYGGILLNIELRLCENRHRREHEHCTSDPTKRFQGIAIATISTNTLPPMNVRRACAWRAHISRPSKGTRRVKTIMHT